MPRGDYQLWVSLADTSHQAGPIPVRRLVKPAAQLPASANFADFILFGGAEVTPLSKEVIEITLLWQAQQPIPQSYTTFVHAVDGAGDIWGQVDRIPHANQQELPTDQWQSGEWIADTFQLSLKPGLPPGKYTLLTGWYNVQTLDRLPILGTVEGQTAVTITSITIQ
jgi:hypothetical protein